MYVISNTPVKHITGWCVKDRIKETEKWESQVTEVSVVVLINFVCQLDRATGVQMAFDTLPGCVCEGTFLGRD